MLKEYSPFTPGVPVPLEFFIGRSQEIRTMITSVRKSIAQKTIERLFVTGERGIGKSSICTFVQSLADRDLRILPIHVFLGGVNTLEEMARRIFERLLRESTNQPWFGKIKDFLGDHIKQMDIFGMSVEFSASGQILNRAVSDFIPTMKNLLNKFGEERTGILLILDDINGLASAPPFANWLKSLVDEFATTASAFPLTLVLVGLPERRRQLVSVQPSLDRVFEIVEIRRFDRPETIDFFRRAFSKVNAQVDEDVLDLLARYSGGYPVFMHELGDAVFKTDTDNHIDLNDALKGIIRGAEVIGAKYVEPKVTAAIRSERYQGILRKIAKEPFEHRFTRKDAVARLTPTEAKVFDNFLRRMEELGAIRKDRDRGPGSYEFASEIYYLFFWMQASTPKEK